MEVITIPEIIATDFKRLYTFFVFMEIPSLQHVYAFRLKPHEDLKRGILAFAALHAIKAACIVSCVGSLERYHLRFANEQSGHEQPGHFEIISLAGTFSESYGHLHLSLADSTGSIVGGHVLDGNQVYTTAELVIMELTSVEFVREIDNTYGFHELVVKKR